MFLVETFTPIVSLGGDAAYEYMPFYQLGYFPDKHMAEQAAKIMCATTAWRIVEVKSYKLAAASAI